MDANTITAPVLSTAGRPPAPTEPSSAVGADRISSGAGDDRSNRFTSRANTWLQHSSMVSGINWESSDANATVLPSADSAGE